ncbi:MAG TPA: ABC transporter substrate-binding protein [Micropepsaceae bacterium]|nr:ABC transporter substrate-binding protein [Micropepsaceae bacterium]
MTGGEMNELERPKARGLRPATLFVALAAIIGIGFLLFGGPAPEQGQPPQEPAVVISAPVPIAEFAGGPSGNGRGTGVGLVRETGTPGGTLNILLPREKDIRLLNVWGYARLVGFNERLELQPDILEKISVIEGRIFEMTLRADHRWSDGAPFTTEDFRYYWEDIANNPELSPSGVPDELLNDGEAPIVEILDARRVRYTWTYPNPRFLFLLAQAREPYIYRPAHYLKQFHARYGDAAAIARMVEAEKLSSWAALHNRRDSMYDNDNPALPTLQPWMIETAMPAQRLVLKRNPHFHRRDDAGQQLPYLDEIVATIAEPSLIPAKTAAGESMLQARGLGFGDITALKSAEARGNYRTLLWRITKGSQVALFPNLNVNDPVWRTLLRDARFRVALSLGIDRGDINRTLYFGLGIEGNNGVLPESPLYDAELMTRNATFDMARANALLDELELARGADGIRLLPDGRKLEIVVETAGENAEEPEMLELIAKTWRELGIVLIIKPYERSVLRNRVYSGETVMSVWSGWNNGVPTPMMSPNELAPTAQDILCWPKWGQYFETKGSSGEAPDMPEAQALIELYNAWSAAQDDGTRAAIWKQMLAMHAEMQFSIGTVAGVSQPVVVSNNLRNVPENGIFGWDPGAQFGIYRMDLFYLKR